MFSGADPVVVLAPGAALSEDVVEEYRDHTCIAVTDAFLLAPWAFALYAHDALWWASNPEARRFEGIKVSGQPTPGVELVVPALHERVVLGPGKILHLRSSGLAAIRWAAAEGAKNIIAVGFGGRGHFHDRHQAPRVRPSIETHDAWEKAFLSLVVELAPRGVCLAPRGEAAPALLGLYEVGK